MARASTTSVSKPFGGPIDGRGETGRPGTEHDQVIDGGGGPDLDAVGESHFCHRRLLQHGPVVSDERRQPSQIHPMVADQLAADLAVLGVERERHSVDREGVSQVMATAIPLLADHAVNHDASAGAPSTTR